FDIHLKDGRVVDETIDGGECHGGVNAAANFPKSAEVKFPNYADGVVERWPFFGGRPLGLGGRVRRVRARRSPTGTGPLATLPYRPVRQSQAKGP
ncbi:hypothetical protein, partial [Ensifer aridi]|uniref:hypothetical protein n=1 Tax=Ensifer aridi TaxID=1708715 RepID=UPI001AEC8D32